MIARRIQRDTGPATRPSEPDAEWLDADDLRFMRRVCVGVLLVWALLATGALAL